eukprot:240890_1
MIVSPPVYDASKKEYIDNLRLCRSEIVDQDAKEDDTLEPPPPYESDLRTCILPYDEECYRNWKDAWWRQSHVETAVLPPGWRWGQDDFVEKRDYTISGFFRGDDDNMYRCRFSPPGFKIFLEMRSSDLRVLFENYLRFLETFDDLRMIRSIQH